MDCLLSLLDWFTFGDAFVGAVVGAFAAFGVSQTNERLRRRRENRVKHWNALVRLNVILIEITEIASLNLHFSQQMVNIVQEPPSHRMTWKNPQEFPIDPSITLDLQNIKLRDELFAYTLKCKRLNRDQTTVYNTYFAMRDCKLSQVIDWNQYRTSFDEFQLNQEKLIEGYDILNKKTSRLLHHLQAVIKQDRELLETTFLSVIRSRDIDEEVIVKAVETKDDSRKQ